MHEPLKNRTYLGIKLFFNFLGTNFFVPKSSQGRKKKPVLGLVKIPKKVKIRRAIARLRFLFIKRR